MKKSILLSLSMLVLATGGIVFGTDCSIYQGQIELYEDRIREYQDAAAGYSASIASQMSAAGLSYSAIGSATSSNPYSSKITELQGKLIQAKADYTNCVYNNQLNDISNEINSLGSYSSRTTKSEGDKACKESFGNYAEVSSSDYSKCVCKDGYTRNSAGTSCVKYTKDIADKECRNEFGSYSEAKASDYSKCVCKDGYTWNSAGTSCVKKTYTKADADKQCQAKFGPNFEALEDNLSQCWCKEGYEFNDDWSDCVKADPCHTYGPNSYLGYDNNCYCKAGFERNFNKNVCVADRQNSLYEGTDFRNVEDLHDYTLRLLDYEDYQSCLKNGMKPINNCKDFNGAKCACEQCEDGYYLSSDSTTCLETTSNTNTVISNTNNGSNKNYNNEYSDEYNRAYEYAYSKKITTMPTIGQANMDGEIIRAEIAKMLANWVKNFGYFPVTSKSCNFKDISSVKGDLYTAIIESCQLGIMGQGISNFRPYDKITRGEVATAISRIIRGSNYEGGNPYYRNHMNALKNIGIIDNLNNPNMNELRGNVMVMLMRASSHVTPFNNNGTYEIGVM